MYLWSFFRYHRTSTSGIIVILYSAFDDLLCGDIEKVKQIIAEKLIVGE